MEAKKRKIYRVSMSVCHHQHINSSTALFPTSSFESGASVFPTLESAARALLGTLCKVLKWNIFYISFYCKPERDLKNPLILWIINDTK